MLSLCLLVCQTCDTNKQSASECEGHLIVPPPSCICSDVPVQGSGPAYSCAQEYNVGNCGQSFLKDAIVGIPEGVTCALAGQLTACRDPDLLHIGQTSMRQLKLVSPGNV